MIKIVTWYEYIYYKIKYLRQKKQNKKKPKQILFQYE